MKYSIPTLLVFALTFSTSLVTSDIAFGFETECFNGDVPCSDGPGAARGKLTGDFSSNEHGRIWRETINVAGIPDVINRPFSLRAVTDGAVIRIDDQDHQTLMPVQNLHAQALASQTVSLEEFAELADFSFSLWDRFSGNETCPIGDDLESKACHGLKTHMGAVNSNHFLPQAYDAYLHYHGLAMAHAAKCNAMSENMDSLNRELHASTLKSCETMALVYEAFGQHFLQDAWSMGHMWERWGSPNRHTMSDNFDAIAIGSVSGLIHGSTAILQEEIGVLGDFSDSLCAPVHEETKFKTAHDHTIAKGLGDLFLPEALDSVDFNDIDGDSEFSDQARLMLSCAAAGILEVYRASGQHHGEAAPAPGLLDVDPTDHDVCFGQRATNAAMKLGAGVDMRIAGVIPYHLELDSYSATAAVVGIASQFSDNYEDMSWWTYGSRVNKLRVDLSRIAALLELYSKLDPEGTQAASGGLGNLLDKLPNGAYSDEERVATYYDSEEPNEYWNNYRARRATKRWNQAAFAWDLCTEVPNYQIRAEVHQLRHRVETAPDDQAQAARCNACIEMARPFVRPAFKEFTSLCRMKSEEYAPYELWVNSDSIDVEELAADWCGCDGTDL